MKSKPSPNGYRADSASEEMVDLNNETYESHFSHYENDFNISDNSRLDRESMRRELNQYVETMSNKKDSDGNSLLNIPSNFSVISNAMTRDDLVSNEEAPWSKFLLEEGLDEQMKKDFHGRYKTFLTDTDSKVQQGLAQIQWLDRQLDSLTVKQTVAPRRKRSSEGDADPTFVTKCEPIANDADTTPIANDADTTPVTASDPTAPLHTYKNYGEVNQCEVQSSGRSLPKHTKSCSAGGRVGLTFEQEYKLAALLSDTYSCPSYKDLLVEEENNMRIFDSQLEEYGRLDRLHVEDKEFCTQCAETDYLAQKRLQRDKESYLKDLDNMLDRCKSKRGISVVLDDLSLAPSNEERFYPTGNSSVLSFSSIGSHMTNTVPTKLQDLNLDRSITRADINSLIQSMSIEEDINVKRDDISEETVMKINHLLASYKIEISRILSQKPHGQAKEPVMQPHQDDPITKSENDPSENEDLLQPFNLFTLKERADLKINLNHTRFEKTAPNNTNADTSGGRKKKHFGKTSKIDGVAQEHSSCDLSKLPVIPTLSQTSSLTEISSRPPRPLSMEASRKQVTFPKLTQKYNILTTDWPLTVFAKTVDEVKTNHSTLNVQPSPPKSMRIKHINELIDDSTGYSDVVHAPKLHSEKLNIVDHRKDKISI